jgi:hypothetical protein
MANPFWHCTIPLASHCGLYLCRPVTQNRNVRRPKKIEICLGCLASCCVVQWLSPGLLSNLRSCTIQPLHLDTLRAIDCTSAPTNNRPRRGKKCQCNDMLLQESEGAIMLSSPRCIVHVLELDRHRTCVDSPYSPQHWPKQWVAYIVCTVSPQLEPTILRLLTIHRGVLGLS